MSDAMDPHADHSWLTLGFNQTYMADLAFVEFTRDPERCNHHLEMLQLLRRQYIEITGLYIQQRRLLLSPNGTVTIPKRWENPSLGTLSHKRLHNIITRITVMHRMIDFAPQLQRPCWLYSSQKIFGGYNYWSHVNNALDPIWCVPQTENSNIIPAPNASTGNLSYRVIYYVAQASGYHNEPVFGVGIHLLPLPSPTDTHKWTRCTSYLLPSEVGMSLTGIFITHYDHKTVDCLLRDFGISHAKMKQKFCFLIDQPLALLGLRSVKLAPNTLRALEEDPGRVAEYSLGPGRGRKRRLPIDMNFPQQTHGGM